MRNLFDQYTQPENRVTHALLTALAEDRNLLRHFLRDLVKVKPPVDARQLMVMEQQYPGEEELSEEELEQRGVPDGWIYWEEAAWCVFIESKVLTKLRSTQIESHRRTAARRGFQRITAVTITPHLPASIDENTVHLEWKEIYAWLRKHSSSRDWARRAAEYLEIAEARLSESGQLQEGTLTMFAGFPFGPGHPYTYLEGKRVLGLALAELRSRRDLQKNLGMNPKLPGRPAITGSRGEAVWDFLSLSDAADAATFTRYPHLTLSVGGQMVEAMITVPNAINTIMRRNLKNLGMTGFQALAHEVVANLTPFLRQHPGAAPWFRGIQRRYPSQKATPFIDARIDFDLRTAVLAGTGPKFQERWLAAAYEAFVNKNGTNYQIQMGMLFSYERCPEIHQASASDLIAAAWLGCKPLVALAR